MSNQTAALQEFEPGALITIDDVMTGVRKLARVNASGKAYIDLDEDGCTPMPIYATLQPQAAGNLLGWGLALVDQRKASHADWSAFCDRLIQSGEGDLVYHRAALWAYQHADLHYDRSLAGARDETQKVSEGRRMLDALVARAGAGS